MTIEEEKKRRQEVDSAVRKLTSDMFDPQVGVLCEEIHRLYHLLSDIDFACRTVLMYEGADWGYEQSVKHSVKAVCSARGFENP